jgi:hypothetical protein
MSFARFRSEQFQRGLARAGTAVWLLAGIVLLAATVRAQWLTPAGTARTAPAAARLVAPAAAEAARPVYQPGASIQAGDEIALVFIGASFCNAHNTPGFPEVVEAAKLRLQRHARQGGMQFRAIGVALDWRAADGLAFLARFGEWDEVASGSNWISDAATKYIWRDIPGDADVPQLLVLRRTVQTGQALRLGEDRVVKRILGTADIEAWVAAGATL